MPSQKLSTEYIAIDPHYCFGKPRIIGTRMTVAAIAQMYLEMGQSLEEIAIKYHLSLASVYAAMSYYYDHREDIDRHSFETDKVVEKMKLKNTYSKFQEQWRNINSER